MVNTKKDNQLLKISTDELLEKLKEHKLLISKEEDLFLTKSGQILLADENPEKQAPRINNPYLDARREWDLRYGSIINQNHRLWIGFFTSWIITFASLFGMYNLARQNHVEPIFFAVDKIGRIIATGTPTSKIKVDQAMMQQQLSNYIIALRSFSSDPEVNIRSYELLKAITAQNMARDVDEIIRKNAGDPGILTITVDITSFNPVPNSTSYQIEWTENRKMADGNSVPAYYRATISVKTFDPNDPNIYYLNPLGLLVTRFDIFKLKPGA